MSLPIPDLDDITYADLVEEARALIPTYDPDWTDHNPSDPGITLIELFAWLTETLIYRADQVTKAHRKAFIKLLRPDWQLGEDLDDEALDEKLRAAVLSLRERARAVTAVDYEALAREASPKVARARLVVRHDLSAGDESMRKEDLPGHVSLIIVPEQTEESPAPQPKESTKKEVWDFLDKRRLLTIRHHVCGPVYVPIGLKLQIARRADMPEDMLEERVKAALADHFHPIEGGPDGNGRPFGRNVYVSELVALLEGIEGVEHVPEIELFSQMSAQDSRNDRRVPAEELWHPNGDLIGLALQDHHLPELMLDQSKLVIAADFVPVTLSIAGLQVAPPAGKEETSRAVKATVRRLFSPHHSEEAKSWRTRPWQVSLQKIHESLAALDEVKSDHMGVTLRDKDAGPNLISFDILTLADVRIDLSFSEEVTR